MPVLKSLAVVTQYPRFCVLALPDGRQSCEAQCCGKVDFAAADNFGNPKAPDSFDAAAVGDGGSKLSFEPPSPTAAASKLSGAFGFPKLSAAAKSTLPQH